ncbi:MAG: helix-turn-helix domain-containing protein [Candidatus Magasanikbacteria bacterium]|nr:helix-turn-helix domain-containing protein [Candidatus Magasanikbacteria bacterium]
MDTLLKQFNFTPQEVAVYKALLDLGTGRVSDIAKVTGQKRTSCQEYVQSLARKGFLISTKAGNKYFYQAEDPDKFRQIANEREFVVGRLVADLQTEEKHTEWQVKTFDVFNAQRKIKRARRKGQAVVEFGSGAARGALLNGESVILTSPSEEIPALEIISSDIVDLHRALLAKTNKL